jgi:hypothetical protein
MQNTERTNQQTPFESNDLKLLRLNDQQDHQTFHESAILQKLQEYRQMMGEFPGFSPEVKLATIQCLISLDQKYGFSEICTSLQELIAVVAEHAFHFYKDDEDHQGAAIFKIQLLTSLYNELAWIHTHGCTTANHEI